MVKRMSKVIFFSFVFLLGVVIGGVKTPDLISYVKNLDAEGTADQQKILKKAPLPKRLRKSKRIV